MVSPKRCALVNADLEGGFVDLQGCPDVDKRLEDIELHIFVTSFFSNHAFQIKF